MTKDFEYMLYLFGKAAVGADIDVKFPDANIDRIRKYAIEQGIWTVIYPVISEIYNDNKYKNEFLRTMSKAIAQKEFTNKIITKINDSGIPCCILKGIGVAMLYNNPEYRISSDTDILISPGNEKKVIQILLEYGYKIEERTKNDHHLKAYHKVGGLLEVHIQLYSRITDKLMFKNMFTYNEKYVSTVFENFKFASLGVNDGLFYLTAHYIKHLVKGGGGIRQMMDLLLYMIRYKEQIDFDRYNKILKELKYYRLIETVKSIGGKYFGMDFEIYDGDLINRLLEDTECGGIFGNSDYDRQNFFKSFFKMRSSLPSPILRLYLWNKSENSFLKKVFVGREALIKEGFICAKYKILLPYAYLCRSLRRLSGKSVKKDVKKNDITRMKLMQDLGMIE